MTAAATVDRTREDLFRHFPAGLTRWHAREMRHRMLKAFSHSATCRRPWSAGFSVASSPTGLAPCETDTLEAITDAVHNTGLQPGVSVTLETSSHRLACTDCSATSELRVAKVSITFEGRTFVREFLL